LPRAGFPKTSNKLFAEKLEFNDLSLLKKTRAKKKEQSILFKDELILDSRKNSIKGSNFRQTAPNSDSQQPVSFPVLADQFKRGQILKKNRDKPAGQTTTYYN
jgi:hypothetical protein